MDISSSLLITVLLTMFMTPAFSAVGSVHGPHGVPVTYGTTEGTSAYHAAQKGISASVNVNSADAETLALELKGVGKKRAQAIVVFREENGPFKSVDEVANVKGISKRIVELNRDKITV